MMDIDYINDAPNTVNSNLPLVEKYRPKSLKEIVSHEDIISTLEKFITQKTIPHLLFHGPAGTGKTSCVMAIARSFYDEKDIKRMVLELNASDDRGINTVREEIKEFSSASSLVANKYKFKLVILDEVDMMTSVAQAALRRVIEKYTSNVRFCLICNQVSRLIPAVQSRCLRIKFSPLKPEVCILKVSEICNSEGLKILGDRTSTLRSLVSLCKGDMRRILNLLESAALCNSGLITEDIVFKLSGKPSLQTLNNIKAICEKEKFSVAFNLIWKIKNELGFTITDLVDIITDDIVNNPNFYVLDCNTKVNIFDVLCKTETLSKMGGNEKLCLSNVIGVLQELSGNL